MKETVEKCFKLMRMIKTTYLYAWNVYELLNKQNKSEIVCSCLWFIENT